ncbi:hypothetical protein GGS24DRAFT_502200 [Hypoxylon argillaceum]|nr:hypothetical protein GGS24DRAFT_502200 [Hypoxylon argillaceum]
MDSDFQRRLEAAMASGDTAWFERMGFPQVGVDEDDIIDEETIKEISPDDASKLAKQRSKSVLESYSALNNVLGRYEDTIRKRWIKKNQGQRVQLLLQAWPGMAKSSQPDMKASRRDAQRQCQCRDIYMWPSINLEDLGSGNTLLRFLNSRGRHWPASFAVMDGESTRLGDRSGALPIEEVPGHEMNLRGNTLETYGVIKPIQYQSLDDMLQNNRFGAAEGLKILEIQDRILAFLRSMCAIILHDKNLENPPDPVVPEPEALPVPTGEWLSAASAARTAPYEVPHNVDLNRLKSFTATRVAEAQDHLWSLREDPSYFSDCIGDWGEHSSEMVLDDRRKIHSDVSAVLGSPFWDRVVDSAVHAAYEDMFHWRLFDEQLAQIIKLRTPAGSQPPSIEQANKCYEAIRKLKLVIESRYIPTLVQKFNVFFPASPPIRALFQRLPDPDGYLGFSIYPRRDLNMKDDLIWIWTTFIDRDALEVYGLEVLALEAERLLRDKAQKARITAMIAQTLSDIGLIGALHNQLRINLERVFNQGKYQAWNDEKTYDDWASRVVRPVWELGMASAPGSNRSFRLGELGNPTSRRFFYPLNKPRTKGNTRALQEAERHLDAFWKKFDELVDQQLTKEARDGLRGMLPTGRQFLRTQDWVAPEPRPKQQLQETIQEISNLSIGSGRDQEQPAYEPMVPKTKVKTTGTPNPATPPSLASADSQNNEAPKPLVIPAVKQRAYKVFSILFYEPNASNQPGEIAWTDFLHAMNAIGFVPEKLYGSVWQFTPLAGSQEVVERAICFHEPHPSGKLAFRTARRYGRRLTRTYGLNRTSFVLP